MDGWVDRKIGGKWMDGRQASKITADPLGPLLGIG